MRGKYWFWNKTVNKPLQMHMCSCVGSTTMLGRKRISRIVALGSDSKTLGAIRGLGRHRIPGIVVDSQPISAWFSRFVIHRYRWHRSMDDLGLAGCLLTIRHGHELQNWTLVSAQDGAVGVSDTQDGLYTLLDINIRPRDWQTLCIACGPHPPHIQYHSKTGAWIPTSQMYPRYSVRWIRAVTDALAGALVARVGITTLSHHGWSFIRRNTLSAQNWGNVLPALGNLAMLAAHFVHKTHITPTKEACA
jgi:predicted ATP-grasp superfamily ATP-dependent carboligase